MRAVLAHRSWHMQGVEDSMKEVSDKLASKLKREAGRLGTALAHCLSRRLAALEKLRTEMQATNAEYEQKRALQMQALQNWWRGLNQTKRVCSPCVI